MTRGIDQLHRLAALKGHQASRERQRAQSHRDAACTAEAAAQAARDAGLHALRLSALAPEPGLDRRGLFERLRESAIPRAKSADALLDATRHEEQAVVERKAADQAQRRGLALQRKQRKLDHWTARARRLADGRQERRSQSETQEEHACRPSRR